MPDDHIIIPGRPRPVGPTRIVDVLPNTAPKIKLEPGGLIVVGDVGLRFAEGGPVIILSLEVWTRTLRRAALREQAKVETESRQVRRAQQRALDQDRQN